MRLRTPSPEPVFVIDTREVDRHGCAWEFEGVRSVRATLKSGDYSFRGGEKTCAIERKTLSDWIGSLTHERKRFEREMDRLAGFHRAVIVVEANLDEVLAGDYRSAVTPKALIGSIASIQSRWGVSTQFIGDRAKAIFFAKTWLLKCWANARVTPFRSRLGARGWRAAA